MMTHLNSSPFPNEDLCCDPSVSPGVLKLGSQTGYLGGGVGEESMCHMFCVCA